MIYCDYTFLNSVGLEDTSTTVLSPTYFVRIKSRMYHFKLSGKLWFNQVLVSQIGVFTYVSPPTFCLS